MGAAPFIGFVGLHYQDFPAAFTPCIEIGWRLAYEHWGKGSAFEAASKVIEYAFQTPMLHELVSFTTVENQRSRKLMERLGMTQSFEDDLEHPKLPGVILCAHTYYTDSKIPTFNNLFDSFFNLSFKMVL